MIRQRPTMQVSIGFRQSIQIALRGIGALEGDSSVVVALLLAPHRVAATDRHLKSVVSNVL